MTYFMMDLLSLFDEMTLARSGVLFLLKLPTYQVYATLRAECLAINM